MQGSGDAGDASCLQYSSTSSHASPRTAGRLVQPESINYNSSHTTSDPAGAAFSHQHSQDDESATDTMQSMPAWKGSTGQLKCMLSLLRAHAATTLNERDSLRSLLQSLGPEHAAAVCSEHMIDLLDLYVMIDLLDLYVTIC